jgi:hypothetical protein
MLDYQLYARILRLETDHEAHCRLRAVQSGQDPQTLHIIVRDIIAADRSLVWC